MMVVLTMWLVTVAALGADAPAVGLVGAARTAIERSVVERMGQGARVSVENLDVRVLEAVGATQLRAAPAPGARTGHRVPFGLFSGARRVGTATALVHVTVAHVRAASPIARDAVVAASDTAVSIGVVDGVRFERLPGPAELVGAGEPLTHASVLLEAAVQSGDEVEVVARVGRVEAHGVGRASGSGYVGDWVRVSSAGQRGLQAARVVAPGVVELTGHARPVRGARPGGKR
jgi:flagella basal body P-ring formation protein FlgA